MVPASEELVHVGEDDGLVKAEGRAAVVGGVPPVLAWWKEPMEVRMAVLPFPNGSQARPKRGSYLSGRGSRKPP
jgi:hypothetical protein